MAGPSPGHLALWSPVFLYLEQENFFFLGDYVENLDRIYSLVTVYTLVHSRRLSAGDAISQLEKQHIGQQKKESEATFSTIILNVLYTQAL